MIKSNTKAFYGDARTGLKQAYIQLEISGLDMGTDNAVFHINHYTVSDDEAKSLIHNNTTPIDSVKYNQLYAAVDGYISANGIDVSLLTPHEKEYLRLKIGLLIYVKTDLLEESGNTVWELEPNNWVLC